MDLQRINSALLVTMVILLVVQNPPRARAATKADMYSLHNDLFTDRGYKKQVRPIENDSNSLSVYMAFSLLSLVEVNEREQNLVSNARLGLSWSDYLLAWKWANFGNITSFLVRQGDIWLPDIQVANSVVKQMQIGYDELPVRVLNSGDIFWSPSVVLSTACNIDVTYYPMDTQVCYIVFETSMSISREININIDMTTPISLAEFSEDGQWEIADTSSENLSDEDSKTKIRFGLILRRRRAYYVVNIVMPVIFLSLTSTLVFALPADAGEKISMGITVLLAYAVYLTIVSEHLPNTSVQTSLLAVYLTTLLGITAVSTMVSVFILKLHHRSAGEKVGRRTQKLVFFLKRITCTLTEEDNHVSRNIIRPSENGASPSPYPRSLENLDNLDEKHPANARRIQQLDLNDGNDNASGRKHSRPATVSQVGMNRRLSSPPVYHAPMTWQDVAQAVDWFLFLTFTIFSLLLTVTTMTILTIGANRSAPTLSHKV